MSRYWRGLERVKNVKKKKPNLGALHTLVRVVLTTRLGKKEIGGWGAEGAQTCACAPSAGCSSVKHGESPPLLFRLASRRIARS